MGGGVRLLIALVVAVSGLAGCRAAEPKPPVVPTPDCSLDQTCGGVRVRYPHRNFVPQGLVLGSHGTAYLSGYLWRFDRQCQVIRIQRRTGKVLAHATLPDCHHGGGVTLSEHGLWVAGVHRLWLLDPAAIGHGHPIRRSWNVPKPITASTLTSTPSGLVIGTFREHRGHTYRFDYDEVMAADARWLVDHGSAPDRVEATSITRSPAWAQGVSYGPGGLWYVSSSTYCGALTRPSGKRQSTVPGAEGLDFDSRGSLWVVSESGARRFQRKGGRPPVPTLTRITSDVLDRAQAPDCAWD
jgi:hypothetical protein